jgi:Glycosyl hydrolase family 92 catalytic domain
MLDTMYPPGPSGLPNNDDLGANSSTFLWEMLGMYPENSGSDNLVFSGAVFPHATISLANGNTVTINAPAASDSNYYVQNLKLNGSPHQKQYVPLSTLAQGATLDWTMGSSPSDGGNAPQDAPPSYTAGLQPVVGFASSPQVTVPPAEPPRSRSARGTRPRVSRASAPACQHRPGSRSAPPAGGSTSRRTGRAPRR